MTTVIGRYVKLELSLCVAPVSALTPQQLEAFSLLSSGFTQLETAQKIGVSERSIQRWVKIPEFAEALKDAGQKATQITVEATAENINSHIQKLIPKAIRALEDILDNDEARNSDKLRASEILGRWAGLAQPQQQQQAPAEENLKSYLAYLANINSNGKVTY